MRSRAKYFGLILCFALGACGGGGGGGGGANVNLNLPGASQNASSQVVAVPATTTPADSSMSTDGPSSGAAASLTTALKDLPSANDSDPTDSGGVAQINGQTYADATGAQFCFGGTERKWTYVLERKYATLQGTVGLSDNSVPDAKIRFEVLVDGRSVYSKDLQVGQSAAVSVSVSGALRLELHSMLLTNSGGCGGSTAEWASF